MRWNGISVLRLLVLTAFCLQSFLVQTHVHPLGLSSVVKTVSVSDAQRGKAPLDADHCFICQEFTHAGAYVMPSIAAALPPMAIVGVVLLQASPQLHAKPHSHNWMGRAPPRA